MIFYKAKFPLNPSTRCDELAGLLNIFGLNISVKSSKLIIRCFNKIYKLEEIFTSKYKKFIIWFKKMHIISYNPHNLLNLNNRIKYKNRKFL